ncbi:MAG: DUF6285 domain-containing protein [Geminicoccaceae bacterium]
MMTEEESLADLLDVARQHLQQVVQPLVPQDKRYDVAMIANALAIASRQINLGPGIDAEERQRLADFYRTPDAGRDALLERLCCELRAGRDGPDIRALLSARTRGRLALSQPGSGKAGASRS